MKKNKTAIFLLILIILNTITIIYLANFRYYVFYENYYKKQFEQNNIYSKLPQADLALNNLFLFFNGKDNIDNDFFNENERSHLQDVKELINKVIVIFYFLVFSEILLVFLLYHLAKKRFKKHIKFVLLYSGSIILITSIIFYLFSNNFNNLFIIFHEIFFPQGNWLFPANSNLINLFPQTFFYSFFYKLMLNSFITSMIIFTIGLLLFSEEK